MLGDRSTKTVTFATDLHPGWNDKANATVKETQKKVQEAHIEISAGGLEDSDIEGPNPFLGTQDSESHEVITMEKAMAARKKNAIPLVIMRYVIGKFFSLSYIS